MAIKKSELYSSLWKSCDELRGGMDASQYKDYILVLLFVKYVSDKYAKQRNALIDVPEGGSFSDMLQWKGKKEIGEEMDKVIARLAEANELTGVIDQAAFNDEDKLGKGKEMVDRLSKLLAIFENPALNFSAQRAGDDDLLGDAYEYLLGHFAVDSGKSKGQFYTPSEVSRVMARVLDLASATSADQSIYDPTCGSGSLLLKAHDEAKHATGFDLALYGQEMDNATSGLAKMNMILHDCPTAEIWKDNTLASPHFKDASGALKRFDFIVANPPFSTKAWTSGFNPANDLYDRFEFGIPPEKNGDYAFLLHMLASLKSTGRAALILPHGVLFRGGAEGRIREKLVQHGYIKGIIGLPANLFYGTGIPACIIVLDKAEAAGRKGIFMVDASKGFIKDGNKNRLREQDIHKIVDTFTRQSDTNPKYARLVLVAEIAANDYNLNLPRYIDSSEPEDLQDLAAHLRGGIPNRDLDALDHYWQVLPGIRSQLFAASTYPGYSDLRVAISAIKPAITAHPEFTAFVDAAHSVFRAWQDDAAILLKAIYTQTSAKALIHTLSEDLLARTASLALIDNYDLYQQLMDYWAATMQDDVQLVIADGWQGWVDNALNTELLPKEIVIARYFAAEAAAIAELEVLRDDITRQREELEEEHGGDDGLLADARTDKGKLTAKSVKDRQKAIKHLADVQDELDQLAAWLALSEQETAAAKRVKDAQKVLDTKVVQQYRNLSQLDVCQLVVHDKWLATLSTAIEQELTRVGQTLTGRLTQLAERYATPLPQLEAQVDELSARVAQHLQKMGLVWN